MPSDPVPPAPPPTEELTCKATPAPLQPQPPTAPWDPPSYEPDPSADPPPAPEPEPPPDPDEVFKEILATPTYKLALENGVIGRMNCSIYGDAVMTEDRSEDIKLWLATLDNMESSVTASAAATMTRMQGGSPEQIYEASERGKELGELGSAVGAAVGGTETETGERLPSTEVERPPAIQTTEQPYEPPMPRTTQQALDSAKESPPPSKYTSLPPELLLQPPPPPPPPKPSTFIRRRPGLDYDKKKLDAAIQKELGTPPPPHLEGDRGGGG